MINDASCGVGHHRAYEFDARSVPSDDRRLLYCLPLPLNILYHLLSCRSHNCHTSALPDSAEFSASFVFRERTQCRLEMKEADPSRVYWHETQLAISAGKLSY